ncbi:CPBP family intramembrane glutamic endopeptidase [Pseudomonas mangiferae]|uniref:CPBP family intramembrane metalloprotease n=1 Tax=Pseudomonas mangiferae TaxID=2593654 RepID=A0A553H237_9PSED|nr:CPBP family intramembrane glutamic endopeptidase [Pseudomonas mangiferae]TRX75793.1 CPBP family intramembrane metalloprotease [Pseudomonas mangiferae]
MPFHLQLLLPLLTLACAYGLGDLEPLGLASGALYAGWVLAGARLPARLWYPVSVIASVALAAHQVPGFLPLTLSDPLQVSPDAPAFVLRLSWDKLLVGTTLLAWWLGARWPASSQPILAALVAAATLLAVPLAAMGLGLVGWQPKWPEAFGLWLALNLGVAVLAEELLFRGLLQGGLSRWLGPSPALLLTALLFGCAHLPFGLRFAAVATLAGLGYGLVYRLGGRLVWAMALHLAVNAAHFLLLTYPARLV